MGRERVSAGELSAADAVEVVQSASAYEEIDQFAKIDHQRTKRTGACAVLPAAEGLPLRLLVLQRLALDGADHLAVRHAGVYFPSAGLPEVVFGQSKTTPQIVSIMEVREHTRRLCSSCAFRQGLC